MKILVPLNDRENLNKFNDAGADEFYLGFYDEKWVEKYGDYCDINRMSGFKQHANKNSFEEAVEIVKQIKAGGKKAFITLNANVYGKRQMDDILSNYLPKLKEAETDGLIVSDYFLAKAVLAEGMNVVASTMCAIYNADIARVYRSAGIKRMIVPRDLSLEEIKKIKEATPDVEYEAFFLRNGCVFSDCYCLGTHRPKYGSTCGFLRSHGGQIVSSRKGFRDRHDIELNDTVYNHLFHQDTCGMCALYRLQEAGVNSLKIVGRADFPQKVCDDIAWTRRNLQILENCKSEEEFLEQMIFPKDSYKRCKLGLSCYYPEVRF